MGFNSGYKNGYKKKPDDYAFLFSGGELLLKDGELPTVDNIEAILSSDLSESPNGTGVAEGLFFGKIEEHGCYAYRIDGGMKDDGIKKDGYEFIFLRSILTDIHSDTCAAACVASHLMHWNDKTRYCGRCGAEFGWHSNERAKYCSVCGNTEYPKISPAIIVAVLKDGKLLLAHNRGFSDGRYSLLAGFMEIGETVEETAAREVKEEAGIEIENIRYLASQCWPFPDSLMIGLTADYKSGEIVPDGEEITHADWFEPGNFPSIPGKGTIARKIIDRYTKEYKA